MKIWMPPALVWNALTPSWVNASAKSLDYSESSSLSARSIPIHTVVIWQADLYHPPFPLTQLWHWLSVHEQQRALRLQTAEKRHEFIAGRGLLRYLLGYYLACLPQHIELEYGLHGKPHLYDGSLQFNMSHSQGQALYALSRSAVGIDLEPMHRVIRQPKRFYHLLVSESYSSLYSSDETPFFQSLSPPLQQQILLLFWICHEAYAKARGIRVWDVLGHISSSPLYSLFNALQNANSLSPRWQPITWKEKSGWLGALRWDDKKSLIDWSVAIALVAEDNH